MLRFPRHSIRSIHPFRAGCFFSFLLTLVSFSAESEQPSPSPPDGQTTKAAAQSTAPSAWSDKETKLANYYLSSLLAEPVYGNIVDLLWLLYQHHEATGQLLDYLKESAESSNEPSVRLIYAHLLRKSGDLKQAALVYDAVLKDAPQLMPALRSRAEVAVELGDEAKAIALYETILAQLPDSAAVEKTALLVELGARHAAAGKADPALAAWQRALALRPQDPVLIQNIAQRVLSLGKTKQAITLYRRLADDPQPERRFAALEELARLHELQEDFPNAAAAIQLGLGMSDFRDARHQRLFRSLVRLYERFDKLPDLERELLAAASQTPPLERHLITAVRFFTLTVRTSDRLDWLRRLTAAVPGNPDYQRELIESLLQSEHEDEASHLLDELLAREGSTNFPLVRLRCELEMRQGAKEKAEERLRKFLADAKGKPSETAAVLEFARSRGFDALAESLLKDAMALHPDDLQAAFDLATYYIEVHRGTDALDLLGEFARSATDPKIRRERFGRIALFLASRELQTEAGIFAREAAEMKDAGTAELLQLADAMQRDGKDGEAAAQCERAWEKATSDDERRDADEKMLAVLSGNHPPPAPPPMTEEGSQPLGGFGQGGGFGSSTPASSPATTPPTPIPVAIRDYAAIVLERAHSDGNREPTLLFRAAWWAFRVRDFDGATKCLEELRQLERGRPARSATTSAGGTPALPVEKLFLDIVLADGRHAQALEQIERLRELDPASRDEYQFQLARVLLLSGERQRGEGMLRELLQRHADTPGAAETLITSFRNTGRLNEAVELWQTMFREGYIATATRLLRPYTRALMEAQRTSDAVNAYLKVIVAESDPRRRRDWLEEQVRLIPPTATTERGAGAAPVSPGSPEEALAALLKSYGDLATSHPLDPFYHEAQALIRQRLGDERTAFAEMKRAYYLNHSSEQNLPQLREAALRAGDHQAAVYFQKQILAEHGTHSTESEWEELANLCEQNFQNDEADTVRRQMERQFSQNPDVLDKIAAHYEEQMQSEDALRVRRELVQLKTNDAPALWMCAKLELAEGRPEAAEPLLDKLLVLTRLAEEPHRGQDDRMPFPPLLMGFGDAAPNPERWRGWADSVEAQTTDADAGHQPGPLLFWLRQPNGYLDDNNVEGYVLRLHALREKSRLTAKRGGAELTAWRERWRLGDQDEAGTVSMRLWALGFAGDRKGCLQVLEQQFKGHWDSRGRFVYALMALANGSVDEALAWMGREDSAARWKAIVWAFNALVETEFPFPPAALQRFAAQAPVPPMWMHGFAMTFSNKRDFRRAAIMEEASLGRMSRPAPEMMKWLAAWACSRGQFKEEAEWYRKLLELEIQPGQTLDFKSYGLILARYLDLAAPDEARLLLDRCESILPSMSPKNDACLCRSFIAARQGRLAEAESWLWNAVSTLCINPKGEDVYEIVSDDVAPPPLTVAAKTGVPNSNAYFPSPGSRTRFARIADTSLPAYWKGADQALEEFSRIGLASMASRVGERMEREIAPLYRGPDSLPEYRRFSLNQLIRSLRGLSPLERKLKAKDAWERFPTAENSLELANTLQQNGFNREAAELYERLTYRATSNSQYAERLLNSCRESGDCATGLRYLARLFSGEIVPPPPALSDMLIYQSHAEFISKTDPDQLRQLAWQEEPPAVGEEDEARRRHSTAVYYLRELAKHYQRDNQSQAAMQSWERLARFLPSDSEALTERVSLLTSLQQDEAALTLLRQVAPEIKKEHDIDGILEAWGNILERVGKLEDVRAMQTVAGRWLENAPRRMGMVSRLLRKLGRGGEARAAITTAIRQAKSPEARRILLLDLLETNVELYQGRLASCLPTLRALFRQSETDGETPVRLSAILNHLPQAECAAWRGWFDRVFQHKPTNQFAAVGRTLLLDETADPMNETMRDELAAALAPNANAAGATISELARSGRAKLAGMIVKAWLPLRNQPTDGFDARIRVATALHDEPSLRIVASELRLIKSADVIFPMSELGELGDLLTELAELSGRPGMAVQAAHDLIEEIEQRGTQSGPCLSKLFQLLMKSGDIDSAERLLKRFGGEISSAELTEFLWETARTKGIQEQMSDYLQPFQPTDGVKEVLLRRAR